MGIVVAFPGCVAPKPKPIPQAGVIYIYASCEDNGCWGVAHSSRSGDSEALLGTHFSYYDALAAAKRAAKRTGALLVASEEPGDVPDLPTNDPRDDDYSHGDDRGGAA
jgi:hypothetical protein